MINHDLFLSFSFLSSSTSLMRSSTSVSRISMRANLGTSSFLDMIESSLTWTWLRSIPNFSQLEYLPSSLLMKCS